MYRKFRYITAIILIITLVFSANASAYAYDTENNDTVVATDAFVQTATDENQEESVPLGFFARVASAFTTCDNAVASAIGFLQPLLADAVADVKTSAQQPDFPVSSEGPDPSRPMVALTFDDGPYSPVTDRIVNKLTEYGGHATFFVVGNRVATYSDSVIKAAGAGNEIANHSWDHSTLTKLTAIKIQKQMHDTDNALQYYIGHPAYLMRPVGGAHNATVDAAVGKPIIMWSVDTLDWKNRNASTVANTVLSKVKDGDIILMHDLYKSTADACDVIIPALTARGYQLVTVSELAAAKGINLQNGVAYSAIR